MSWTLQCCLIKTRWRWYVHSTRKKCSTRKREIFRSMGKENQNYTKAIKNSSLVLLPVIFYVIYNEPEVDKYSGRSLFIKKLISSKYTWLEKSSNRIMSSRKILSTVSRLNEVNPIRLPLWWPAAGCRLRTKMFLRCSRFLPAHAPVSGIDLLLLILDVDKHAK